MVEFLQVSVGIIVVLKSTLNFTFCSVQRKKKSAKEMRKEEFRRKKVEQPLNDNSSSFN